MIATDQNGLTFDVYECGVDHVRDEYHHVYRLRERTGTHETWADGDWADGDDVITTERCKCEGAHDPAPGAAIFNGDHVERCDDCQRFASDEDAAAAYVAGLNRAVGRRHFVFVYAPAKGVRSMPCVALTNTTPPVVLTGDAIHNELAIAKATVTSIPYGSPSLPDVALQLSDGTRLRGRLDVEGVLHVPDPFGGLPLAFLRYPSGDAPNLLAWSTRDGDIAFTERTS